MQKIETVKRVIHVDAIVELKVFDEAAELDINDIVGFFVALQDVSSSSDREASHFKILNIYPQSISVRPLSNKKRSSKKRKLKRQ